MKNEEALLAEYTLLRDELVNISNNQHSLFVFAFTSIGAVLSFAIQSQNEQIPLIAFFILICVKGRLIQYRDNYYVKFVYIRVILEPKLNVNSMVQRGIKTSRISKIQHFSFSFLGVGSLFAIIMVNPDYIMGMMIALVLQFIIVILDCYYTFGAKKLYGKIENQYKKLLS